MRGGIAVMLLPGPRNRAIAIRPCASHPVPMQTRFSISTRGQGLYEFTPQVTSWLKGQGDGLLTLFVQWTDFVTLVTG